MKNHLSALIIITLFIIFSLFISINNRYYAVTDVITPVKIKILTNNKRTPITETICIDKISSFSLYNDDNFANEYKKSLNISNSDLIGLGYLATEYSQKLLQNKKISLKYTGEITKDCKYADIKLDGMDYTAILGNSGFGVKLGNVLNKEKFKNNLENARKLNLVILNHHSNKYHTLDCPYGIVAHDSIIIPLKQVPSDALPCKFCHNNKNMENKTKMEILIPQPATTQTSGNIKMYFTDFTKNLKPNNNCTTKVCKETVNLINNSNSTIDIAIYGYDNNPEITNALTKAKERGVIIRYVYDSYFNENENHYNNNSIITALSSENRNDKTNLKTSSNYIMHNKFIIFDGMTVLTGSMNISKSGLSDFDVNNIVIIKSQDAAKLYTYEFEQMLSGKFHQQKEKLNYPNHFITDNSEIEIYFSPKDNSVARIVQLINSSKKYIYIPTFLITHRKIAEALISAKRRGVDVRIIIDGNGVNTSHSKHQLLRDNGILVKTENYAGKLHSKSIIIDDEYIITGSMNFSYSGADKNDENVLIIKNKTLTTAYKNFFLYLWTLIPNKYLTRNARAESNDSIGSCTDGVDNNFNGLIDTDEPACK